MLRRFSRVLFSLLLLVPTTCFGQAPLRKILSGYIREEGTGRVIGEARIELQNAMGTPIGFAYSDRNGAYEFDDIGGDCYVAVQRDGYAPVREFVRPDGSGHVYRDILLRVLSAEAAPKSASPVSEHQLSIPRKAREEFDSGVQLIITKSDYRGAVARFAKAIAKYPSYYEAFAAMGLAESKMGDAQAAEVALRKSISLSAEKYPQAMLDLASMLSAQKRFSDAESLLRKVLALDSSSWRAQFELSVALSGQHRYKEALASASAARDLKPDNPQVYLLLYNLHIRADDFPGALQDTQAYLKLAPDGATADRVRLMQQQIQKAVESSGSHPGPSSEAAPAPPAAAPAPESPAIPATIPSPSPSAAPEDPPEPGPAASPDEHSVIPLRVDESVPEVALDVPCSLPTVLQGADRRAEQLLTSLQKFDASERIEHYKLNAAGVPGPADVRSFDYVVAVSHDSQDGFQLQEYRNGAIVNPSQFPSGIVTSNLTAHALIFHHSLSQGFHFTCEGLGEWRGHPTWLVHFEQKPDQRDSFRSYIIQGILYPVLLTGRAWIDARSFQVLHLESDLIKPVEKIRLTREHISIDYAAVRFHSRREQLWLPQSADLYVELRGRRFYRRHIFSNFKIFSTDTTQQVHAPKESFCFTNTSNLLITGILNATPVPGKALKPASLTLSLPAKSTVCKTVGAGKDLNIPAEFLASSIFAYRGPADSVEANSFFPNANAPEVVLERSDPVAQHP